MKKVLFGILVLSFSISSSFAKSSRSSARPQTFPATEEGPSDEVISSAPGYGNQAAGQVGIAPSPAGQASAPESSDEPVVAKKMTKAQKKAAKAAAVTTVTPPAQAPVLANVAGTKGYDEVPSNQTEPLIRRLRLAETLVTQFGRAYDYRTMTVIELQGILNQLELSSQKQVQQRAEERAKSQVEYRQSQTDAPTQAAVEQAHDSIGSEAPTDSTM